MQDERKILARQNDAPVVALAAAGAVPVQKELVNLNYLIATAVRQAEHPSGSVILRMDELPEYEGSFAQLQQAVALLLRFMLAQIPAAGKVYCYVKGIPAGGVHQDGTPLHTAYCLQIHTNAQAQEPSGGEHLLHQAAMYFANNKIGFEYKKVPASGMLFLLTLHGSTSTDGMP